MSLSSEWAGFEDVNDLWGCLLFIQEPFYGVHDMYRMSV